MNAKPLITLALAVLSVPLLCTSAEADLFTPETIRRFAPLLVVEKGEDNGPASAHWFLKRSILRFAESPPCPDATVYGGEWSRNAVARLGLSVSPRDRWRYRNRLGRSLCRHRGATLTVTDYTRPFDRGRAAGLHASEGFFLSFTGSAAGMAFSRDRRSREFKTAAPIYYDDGELSGRDGTRQRARRAYITYWFFYAYNDAPPIPLLWNHQGDWENMSLLFVQSTDSGEWILRRVAYAAHGAPEIRSASCSDPIRIGEPLDCPAPRVSWRGAPRLVGFVANGDHATYPSPGRHRLHLGVSDRTSSVDSGFSWPTWRALLPLESQLWAGFCGGWGKVGATVPVAGRRGWAEDRTGPLGPGCLDRRGRQRKTGRPVRWGISKSSTSDRGARPGSAIGVGL